MKGTGKRTAKKRVEEKKVVKKTGKKQVVRKAAKKGAKKTVRKKAANKRPSVRKTVTASAPSGVPNIDYGLCEGCGGCADAFPHFFEMRGERAWVVNAEEFDPVRDAGIMTVCPYYAISIEKV